MIINLIDLIDNKSNSFGSYLIIKSDMIVNALPSNLLVKSKIFRAVFAFGILCILATLTLGIIMASSHCVDMNYCHSSTYFYHTCYTKGAIYCCSSSKNGPDSCGKYTNSCFYSYSGKNCTGLWISMTATGGTGLLCLLVMAGLAYRHKRRLNSLWLEQYMRRQNDNMIYSDRVTQVYPEFNAIQESRRRQLNLRLRYP